MEENLGSGEGPIKHEITVSKERQVYAEGDSSDTEKSKEDPDLGTKNKYAAGTSHTLSGSDENVSDAEGTQEEAVSSKDCGEVASEMRKSDQEVDEDDADSTPVGADKSAWKPSSTKDSEADISDDEPLVLVFRLHSALSSFHSFITLTLFVVCRGFGRVGW